MERWKSSVAGLSKLIANALGYGRDTAIQVPITGESSKFYWSPNQGKTIDPATFDLMFEPLRRGEQNAADDEGERLGDGPLHVP